MRTWHTIPTLGPRPSPYVPGEVLLLGPETHVRHVLDRAPRKAAPLHLLDRMAFPAARSLGKRPPFAETPWGSALSRPRPEPLELVRVRLPELAPQDGGSSLNRAGAAALEEAALTLQELSQHAGLPVHVEPHCIVGDPLEWEVDAFTHRVLHVGENPARGARLFRSQATFQAIGLASEDGQRLLPPGADGAGVLVAVMDTAPARNVSPLPFPPPWLTLHSDMALSSKPEGTGSLGFRDFSDHGLMTASLVHAVAPDAEIHLYPVLDATGQGPLFGLLRALAHFTARSAGRLAVINLSLGSTCGQSGSGGALALALLAFADQGGVICAAAGNTAGAALKASALPAAQPPASLPYTIAVAASTREGRRAAYSHRGDIAAPGGEALGAPGPGDPEDPIGMAASHPEAAASGYIATDAGTSFATPLVAGASALMLQAIAQWPTGLTLERGIDQVVLDLLARTATPPPQGPPMSDALATDGLGAGILNVAEAVSLSRAYV